MPGPTLHQDAIYHDILLPYFRHVNSRDKTKPTFRTGKERLSVTKSILDPDRVNMTG